VKVKKEAGHNAEDGHAHDEPAEPLAHDDDDASSKAG